MENINVCVRIKPRLGNNNDEQLWKYDMSSKSITNLKTKENFTFDNVILPNQNNNEVFQRIVLPILDNFFNGINVSVFAYGQTSTGKTYTMKGTNNLDGIIPKTIGEIFSRLANNKDKHTLRVSYLEIYNETVNDLLDLNKKNLEIRESLQKGVFVNNLTEVVASDYDRVIQLLKQGDCNKVVAETKLNEKSSRSHTIFRLGLEISKEDSDGKVKNYLSQLNLIDLAGSENVSKAKTDGIRMKEGSNINKSLLALSNVINKLSANPKSFVNYRDSKLTRLLQPALSGNSKTAIICTVSETQGSYSETLNTLHFGLKAKNVKTIIKVNEYVDEKNKAMMENVQLRNKIKQLEEMIQERRSSELNNPSQVLSNPSNQTSNSQNEMITTLEKEVKLLKRILISNEEIGEDTSRSISNDRLSTHSGNLYNNLMNNNNTVHTHYAPSILQSGSKQYGGSKLAMLMSSGKKLTDSARKLNFSGMSMTGTNLNLNCFNEPEVSLPQTSNASIFRRCMTESKLNNGMYNAPYPTSNSFIQNSHHKSMGMSAFKPYGESEFDFPYPSTSDSYQLLKENEELRRSLYEFRKTYYDVVQSKDNQIKSLNHNYNITLENCEKLIKEAEDNYLNLQLNYERTKEDVVRKELEAKQLQTKLINLEASNNFHREEIKNLKDKSYQDKYLREMEVKYNDLTSSYERLKLLSESDKTMINELQSLKEKLISDNNHLKTQNDNMKSENMSYKAQYDVMKRNSDLLLNENSKFKHDIESYKNEISTLKKKGDNSRNNNKSVNTSTAELEGKLSNQNKYIAELELQVSEYKSSLVKLEETQIKEYQKLLDESFEKINELNRELKLSNERNGYLKQLLDSKHRETPLRDLTSVNRQLAKATCSSLSRNQTERSVKVNTAVTNATISQFSYGEEHSLGLKEDSHNNEPNTIEESNSKDFIGKKRKFLPKVYQNIIDKNLSNDGVLRTPRPNKENEVDQCEC